MSKCLGKKEIIKHGVTRVLKDIPGVKVKKTDDGFTVMYLGREYNYINPPQWRTSQSEGDTVVTRKTAPNRVKGKYAWSARQVMEDIGIYDNIWGNV